MIEQLQRRNEFPASLHPILQLEPHQAPLPDLKVLDGQVEFAVFLRGWVDYFGDFRATL